MTYAIHRSTRCRGIRLTVKPDGSVRISAHPREPLGRIERFLEEKMPWIVRTIEKIKARGPCVPLRGHDAEYRRFKSRALQHLRTRARELAGQTGFTPSAVRIRNASSRWGSCSRKGELMFHYRLMFLPADLCDYVILHELCHLRHFNHSKSFWSLLSQFSPACASLRRILHKDGARLASEAAVRYGAHQP